MKKFVCFVIILVFTFNVFSQIKKEESNREPKTAIVKISLLDLPGANEEKSKWEVSYELRVITEKEMREALVAGKLKYMDGEEKLGVLIGKGSFTKNALSKTENREATLTLPLNEEIQNRLNNQLKNRANVSLSSLNEKRVGTTKDTETEAQIFLFYASALVYDAKLKKNVIIPLNWILPFFRHPNANFEMTLQVKENGEYASMLVLPEKSRNSLTKTVRQ